MSTSRIETSRLYLRNLALQDAGFIYKLLNSPTWLEHIGDRNIKNQEDAIDYITNSPARSYRKSKNGLKAVILRSTGQPIGLCGFIKRDYLTRPDLGFAFLPEFAGQGFGYESSKAILDQPHVQRPVYAMTGPDNLASQGLLKKLGFELEGKFLMPTDQFECLMFKFTD